MDPSLQQPGAALSAWLAHAHWTLWLQALAIPLLLAGAFVVLRWLFLRRWHSVTARRLLWAVELVVLPLLIVTARQLLVGLDLGARPAGGVEVAAGVALCLALAWLADRGIGLFLLTRLDDGAARGIPRILRIGIRVALYLLALVIAFTLVLERDALGFVVSGSVVLGVLGLALQGVLQDTFAGIALSIEEPFHIGDWIELDDGSLGQVLDISWRSTRLRSFEHGVLIVPNHRMASARIHNYTQDDVRHALMLDVHLSNEIDPAMGRRLLLEAVLATPGTLQHPAPSVNLADGGGRPYRYLLYFHCTDYVSTFVIKSKLYERIWRHLRQLGLATAPAANDLWLHRAASQDVHEEDIDRLVQNTPLFAPLTEHERAELLTAVGYRVFPADSAVVRQGEAGDSLFIIAGGRVRVSVSRRGRSREIARLGSGDYFGEISLLTGATRSATVTTVTECTLLEIDREALTPILGARPELSATLAEVEARRQLEMEHSGVAGDASADDVGRRAREMLWRMRRFFRI